MIYSAHTLEGYAIQASDGEIGKVEDLLFDDEKWTIRYIVVNTGGWLTGRLGLVSPIAVQTIDWESKLIKVNITRQQVEESPDISTDQPVSRQIENDYARYYGYPSYWGGAGLWGMSMYPLLQPSAALMAQQGQESPDDPSSGQDSHLRSAKTVIGYHIQALDEAIGHVEDFLVDAETWTIRYMVVDTKNWLPGKKVLVSPEWIAAIDWTTALVHVDLFHDSIKNAPPFEPDKGVTREDERTLHGHYQRQGYWEKQPEQEVKKEVQA